MVTAEGIKQRVERIKGEEQESDYVYKKFVYPLLKKGYVDRIRQGLYHVTTPGKQDTSADRYLVASKIREEYQELKDANKQGDKVLQICELTDLIGAIESYSMNQFNLSIEDLKKFSDKTKQAFQEGKRG